jgi:hypothetical protein
MLAIDRVIHLEKAVARAIAVARDPGFLGTTEIA